MWFDLELVNVYACHTLIEIVFGQLPCKNTLEQSAIRIGQEALKKTLDQSGVGYQNFIYSITITRTIDTHWLRSINNTL